MAQKSMVTILIFTENSELISEICDFFDETQYSGIEWPPHSPIKDILHVEVAIHAILFDVPDREDKPSHLVRTIKIQAPLIPIIALVDEGHVKDTVRVMQEGARTVITKPVDKQLLLLALNNLGPRFTNSVQPQSIIQQAIELLQSLNTGAVHAGTPLYEASPTPNNHQEVLKLDDLTVDLVRQKAFYRDAPVELTASQFRLLSCLAKSPRRIVPYEEMYFYLHNIQLDSASARTALSAHLSYLRAKLSEVGCEDYLVNIRGQGYVLDIPLEAKTRSNDIDIDLVLQQLPIVVWTTDVELRVTSVLGTSIFHMDNKPTKIMRSHVSDFLQLDPQHTILLAHQQALVGQRSQYEQWRGSRLFYIYIVPYMDHNNEIIGSIGLALPITNSS